ncbi:uncharacterized protein LOC116253445 [Nymphaea colorata]|nr:uncharacterized protein LOC116253445 [Nymphaea colorata]
MSSTMGRCQTVWLRPCRGFWGPAVEKESPGCVTASGKCQPLRLRRRLGRQCRTNQPLPANNAAVSGANKGETSVQPPEHQCSPPWQFRRCDAGYPCGWSPAFRPMQHWAFQEPPPQAQDAAQTAAAVPASWPPGWNHACRRRFRQRALPSAAEDVEGNAAAPAEADGGK